MTSEEEIRTQAVSPLLISIGHLPLDKYQNIPERSAEYCDRAAQKNFMTMLSVSLPIGEDIDRLVN